MRHGPAGAACHRLRSPIQLDQAVANELDATIATRRQHVEDPAVEQVGAMHLVMVRQGTMERSMIETAQVASAPDQGGTHMDTPDFLKEADWMFATHTGSCSSAAPKA